MKKRWLTSAWRASVLVLLAYIGYGLHISNGGMTLGYFLQSVNPFRIIEGPAPPSPSGGPSASFDSLYPEQAEQAFKFKMERENNIGRKPPP